MPTIKAADLSQGVRALADDLSTTVTSSALRTISAQTKRISRLVKAGDFEAAKAEVRELSFKEALSKPEKAFRKWARAGALLGAGAIDSPTQSIWANGAPFPWEVDTGAVRQATNMATHILDRDARRRLEDRVDAASKFQKAEPIDPDKLAGDINRFLRGEIARVVDTSANVVGTRVSAYGMYHEARVRGIQRYRIDAILDDRTTDICKNMDGREFTIDLAYNKTAQALSITDPAKLKAFAPFPNLDEIAALSNEEIQAQGFDTPPFHFLCRSVVTLIDTDADYEPVNWSNYPSTNAERRLGLRNGARLLTAVASTVWGNDDLNELFTRALRAGPEIPRLYHPNNYTGNGYREVNDRLRKNRPWEDGSELPEMAGTLDELIEEAVVPNVVHVYRGVKPGEAAKLQTGAVFQDDAFVSTSLDAAVALEFTSTAKVVMQIEVGTGKRALPVYATSTVPAEWEVLLPRGAQFRVVGSAEQIIDGEKVTVVRVVYQGDGEKLDLDEVGLTELPTPESVVKELGPGHGDKFVYSLDDLRPVALDG